MKKLLILGASILQLPAIMTAKEMGLFVSVIDYNPQAVGIKYADEYYNASTNDIEEVCKIAKIIRPDGIMTLATDMPMRSLAAATELLNLQGISRQTAINATDKAEMIKIFEKNGVEAPWYYVLTTENELSQIAKKLTFPCIIKPTDSSGSRGVFLVNNSDEIWDAYLYARKYSRNGCVIIEEYLKGNEVSVEVMVVNGKVNILAITDKITTGSPYFVEMGHSQPSQLKSGEIETIKDLAIRAVIAIGIKNGPAHVEIMYTLKGAKMIELGARMGGDCIATHLVPLSTGIDMVKATIEIALGETPDISPKFNKGSAIMYFSSKNGEISSINGVEDAITIEGVKEINFSRNAGDWATAIKSSTDRIGFVIAQGKDGTEALNICEKAIKTVKIGIRE
jgi:biotin carboxylase